MTHRKEMQDIKAEHDVLERISEKFKVKLIRKLSRIIQKAPRLNLSDVVVELAELTRENHSFGMMYITALHGLFCGSKKKKKQKT